MNVLLLTPDAVGGTLLHTTLAVYMQLHRFDKPVFSLYDLALGVETYYSNDFNREIVRTREQYQTLSDIQQIVNSVDHYKVAKLTQYNIRRRQDTIADQVPFYQWLNDNFLIIACRRDNVFEHSLSWALNKITNRLNVYSFAEKLQTFAGIYSDGVNIDPLSLKRSLEDYRMFLTWCDNNFSVASYYSYEQNLHRLEDYILDLPIFAGQGKLQTWHDVFGIDFKSWNQHHFLANDIGGLVLENQGFKTILSTKVTKTLKHQNLDIEFQQALANFIEDYTKVSAPGWPLIKDLNDYYNLPDAIRHECEFVHKITYWLETSKILLNQQQGAYGIVDSHLDNNQDIAQELETVVKQRNKEMLSTTDVGYANAGSAIERMRELGILGKTIPVKKQTLAEKAAVIKNFDQCVDVYNQWITDYPEVGKPVDSNQLKTAAMKELEFWKSNQCKLK